MSKPSSIREDTLLALRGTRRDMSRARWLLALKKQPPERRREAALARLNVEQALLALSNEKLSAIGRKLTENESELRAGSRSLRRARRKLNRVRNVLIRVDALLQTIAKIVTFVHTG